MDKKDLPKVIDYLTNESMNVTLPRQRREALELIISDLKEDYIDFVYQAYLNSNELEESYKEELATRWLNTNNGENLEWFDEYCEDQFKNELSTDDELSTYEKVIEAVMLGTFNI